MPVADRIAPTKRSHALLCRPLRMLVRQKEIAYKLPMGKQENKLFRTPLQETYRRLNPFHELPVAFGAFAVDIIGVQLPPIGDDPGTPLGKGRADAGRRRRYTNS